MVLDHLTAGGGDRNQLQEVPSAKVSSGKYALQNSDIPMTRCKMSFFNRKTTHIKCIVAKVKKAAA